MTMLSIKKLGIVPKPLIKLAALLLVFVLIFVSIALIRSIPKKGSEFEDTIAAQIAEELDESQIVLSVKNARRTVAEFKEPILLTHGKESRLIVHTAHLSETVSFSSEGIGGWA